MATKWLGEGDFSREYVVKCNRNPDSMTTFFLLPGRPNLRRNVRELMSERQHPPTDLGWGPTVDVLESVGD